MPAATEVSDVSTHIQLATTERPPAGDAPSEGEAPTAYAAPRTLAEALELLRAGDATILAGGTDLMPQSKAGRFRLQRMLVNIRRVPELHGISESDGVVRLGALTTITPRNKDLITGVPRGTIYDQQAGGGGGYGDPKKRDRAKLAEEVRDGLISPQAARTIYGA